MPDDDQRVTAEEIERVATVLDRGSTSTDHLAARYLRALAHNASALREQRHEAEIANVWESVARRLEVHAARYGAAHIGTLLMELAKEFRSFKSTFNGGAALDALIAGAYEAAAKIGSMWGADVRIAQGIRALTPAAAAERDAEACRGVLREVTAALCDYVKVNSLEHDDPDCPQDDTCECVVFGRLSRALDASVAALRETT